MVNMAISKRQQQSNTYCLIFDNLIAKALKINENYIMLFYGRPV